MSQYRQSVLFMSVWSLPEYARNAVCPETCSSRTHNPALNPTLTVRLSDKCNLCSRLVDCWFWRMELGGRSSCPCRRGQFLRSLRLHSCSLVSAGSMLYASVLQGKSNHWFCSSSEDLAFLLPSAQTVTHS